jgi:hypothetical protein
VIAKRVSVCLLLLGSATGIAGPPREPGRVADPNDPANTRMAVSPEEREKLGLTPHTWTGVVHPDVYPKLDQLKATVASLKHRLVEEGDKEAWPQLRRVKFEGTVFVQVQLKNKDAQRRVLASLKATEFHPRFLFDGAPGFLGYVTKEGLDKLGKHADVVGVCLDDKPLVESGPKHVLKNDLPPPKPGDESSEHPGVKEGKVDPDLYRAFDLSDRVDVIITFRSDGLPGLIDSPSIQESRAQGQRHEQAVVQLQNRVLSNLSADDFWLWTRYLNSAGAFGWITQEGLQKLSRQPEVQRINMQRSTRLLGLPDNGRISK